LSDGGSQLNVSHALKKFLAKYNIHGFVTLPWNSRSNSICESSNALLRKCILKTQNAFGYKDWTEAFGDAKYFINSLTRTYNRGTEKPIHMSALELCTGIDPVESFHKLKGDISLDDISKLRGEMQREMYLHFRQERLALQKADSEYDNLIEVGDAVLTKKLPIDKNQNMFERNVYKCTDRHNRMLTLQSIYGKSIIKQVHVRYCKKFESNILIRQLKPEVQQIYGKHYDLDSPNSPSILWTNSERGRHNAQISAGEHPFNNNNGQKRITRQTDKQAFCRLSEQSEQESSLEESTSDHDDVLSVKNPLHLDDNSIPAPSTSTKSIREIYNSITKNDRIPRSGKVITNDDVLRKELMKTREGTREVESAKRSRHKSIRQNIMDRVSGLLQQIRDVPKTPGGKKAARRRDESTPVVSKSGGQNIQVDESAHEDIRDVSGGPYISIIPEVKGVTQEAADHLEHGKTTKHLAIDRPRRLNRQKPARYRE
jgi:hypothetical protein